MDGGLNRIEKVQKEVAAVQEQILQAKDNAAGSRDPDERQYWRRKEEQLRKEQRQLREEELLLLKIAASLGAFESSLRHSSLLSACVLACSPPPFGSLFYQKRHLKVWRFSGALPCAHTSEKLLRMTGLLRSVRWLGTRWIRARIQQSMLLLITPRHWPSLSVPVYLVGYIVGSAWLHTSCGNVARAAARAPAGGESWDRDVKSPSVQA